MTFKDLEYFVLIAEKGSITRAASQLFVAQPALSQCIQKLEKETGSELFVRNNTGVVLTSEGQCFFEFAQKVLREQAQLKQRLRDVDNSENGEIRLGFTGTQATYVLPYILPDFQAKYPGISVTLIEATSSQIEQKLVRHEVDIGILHLPVLQGELDYFEFSKDNMIVIPSRRSRYKEFVFHKPGLEQPYIDLDFFKEEPIILTLPGQRSRMVCDQILANAGIVPKICQISRNLSTLDALSQVDYASVIMPSKQISLALQQRESFRIDERFATPYSFVLSTLKNAYLSVAARHLQREFLVKKYTF